jgi:hypothetical protein
VTALEVAGDWLDRAACRTYDVDLFVPPDPAKNGGRYSKAAQKRIARARTICAGCPVADECVADGATDLFGIRGGLLPEERGAKPAPVIAHGTTAGYRAHYRQGVPMCEACRSAHRVADREARVLARQDREAS